MSIKWFSTLILIIFILSIIFSPFSGMAEIDEASYYPNDKSSPSKELTNTIKNIKEVTFGNNKIKGVLYIPDKVPAPAIIFCNGKDTSIERYRYYDYDKWPERRYINPETICKEGYAVLMIEFRGYDATDGFFTFDTATEDISDAIDFWEEQDDVIKDKIGIVGFSLGGSIAIRAAAEDDRIKTCIAICPIINIYDTSINWMNNQQNLPENLNLVVNTGKEYLSLILSPNNPFLTCLKPFKFLRAPKACPADLCLISFYLHDNQIVSCSTEGVAISKNPKVSPAYLEYLFNDLEEYDVYSYIKEIYPRPVLIVSGTEDQIVSIDDVVMLQNKLLIELKDETDNKNIEFLYYDGDHCILDKETADDIIKFLNENLK